MVNIVTIMMMKTLVTNFRSSVQGNVKIQKKTCAFHIFQYTKIQMALQEEEQIKYTNDFIINILYIKLWMSLYKLIFEDSSLLESVIWYLVADKTLWSNNLLELLHPQGSEIMFLPNLTKYLLLDMV